MAATKKWQLCFVLINSVLLNLSCVWRQHRTVYICITHMRRRYFYVHGFFFFFFVVPNMSARHLRTLSPTSTSSSSFPPPPLFFWSLFPPSLLCFTFFLSFLSPSTPAFVFIPFCLLPPPPPPPPRRNFLFLFFLYSKKGFVRANARLAERAGHRCCGSCCCSVPQPNALRVTRYTFTNAFQRVGLLHCVNFHICFTPPHGQLYAVFGELISFSEGWVLPL